MRVRWLALALSLCAVVAGSYWLLTTVQSTLETTIDTNTTPLLSVFGLRSTRFNTDGLPESILSSPHANHFEAGRGTDILRPTLELFSAQRMPIWSIDAGAGWLSGDGNELRLASGVNAERWPNEANGPLRIATESMTYRSDTQRAFSDDPVTIDARFGHAQAQGFTLEIESETLELHHAVEALYQSN